MGPPEDLLEENEAGPAMFQSIVGPVTSYGERDHVLGRLVRQAHELVSKKPKHLEEP